MRELVIIADDLSGAADCGIVCAEAGLWSEPALAESRSGSACPSRSPSQPVKTSVQRYQWTDAMRLRHQTVEHPFGTIKAWMGASHFLTRTLKRVSTEISLQVMAYNLKQVIAILGIKLLMEAIRT